MQLDVLPSMVLHAWSGDVARCCEVPSTVAQFLSGGFYVLRGEKNA